MNDLTKGSSLPMNTPDYSNVSSSSARQMKEVEGAIVLAKRFPRDILGCIQRIKDNCKRVKLAEKAMYAYPRGGQVVTGPSIRLAEVIAQSWGNLDFGIREVSSENGTSVVQAYCWDYETNVRQVKEFKVDHVRYTRSAGRKKLTDPRDIYEMVANQGARRLRACILGVIPLDVIEEAVDECQKTLSGANSQPIQDRISAMLNAFTTKHQVTKEMLESRLGHDLSATSEQELVILRNIFNSLNDGASKRSDWFAFKEKEKSNESNKINKIMQDKKPDVSLEVECDSPDAQQEANPESDAFRKMRESLGE